MFSTIKEFHSPLSIFKTFLVNSRSIVKNYKKGSKFSLMTNMIWEFKWEKKTFCTANLVTHTFSHKEYL